MDKLGRYIELFAELLGIENNPVFKGVQDASVGLRALVPAEREIATRKRILELKSDLDGRPSRAMRQIEAAMGQDGFPTAEIRDARDNVIYVAHWCKQAADSAPRISQQGSVDGTVTGLIGADDTLHLYLRDLHSRDLKLIVRSVDLSRALLQRFRSGRVRLNVHGSWVRTELGWVPEASKCYVDSFTDLDEAPLAEVFADLNRIPGNGWAKLDDPIAEWERIRGIHQ